MNTETKTIQATCLCGSARHEITLPSSEFPLQSVLCHCSSCRHMSGAMCLSVAFLPTTYEPSPELLEKLFPFDFSKRIRQYHCKKCGSCMLARCLKTDDPDGEVSWDAASGTLEQADGVFEVREHWFVGDTLDGGFADFLPEVDGRHVRRFARKHGDDADELPLPMPSTNKAVSTTPSASDRLHAHCKCGGVGFWIARPSERSRRAESPWPDLLVPYHLHESGPEGATWWMCADGTKFLAGVCSCDSCRLDSGMEWIQWTFIPTVDMSLDEEGKVPFSWDFGTLRHWQSSEKAERYFCGTCGATVFFKGLDRPTLVDVAVGLLDAPEGARAESWLEWRTSRLSFREDSIGRARGLTEGVEDGLRRYEERIKNKT